MSNSTKMMLFAVIILGSLMLFMYTNTHRLYNIDFDTSSMSNIKGIENSGNKEMTVGSLPKETGTGENLNIETEDAASYKKGLEELDNAENALKENNLTKAIIHYRFAADHFDNVSFAYSRYDKAMIMSLSAKEKAGEIKEKLRER